jgi:hypothetical protein
VLLHLIADYGPGDLAFTEIAQRLKLLLPQADVLPTTVPAFATLAAGFCVAQLALNEAPEGMVVFHNVAPRRDDSAARTNNAGERLAYLRLPGGVQVVGVNAGYAFSFLRDLAEEFRYISVPAAGSQFRSRDLFPEALADVVAAVDGALAEAVAPGDVPAVPDSCVAYVDSFGNIKTTLTELPWQPGSAVRVRIGAVERRAYVAGEAFSVPQGSLALAAGSSGWPDASGGQLRFRELFLRGGNAWDYFGRPAPESSITVSADSASLA